MAYNKSCRVATFPATNWMRKADGSRDEKFVPLDCIGWIGHAVFI